MEHEFDAGLAYELMNMAEEGRAVWAAVSTEDPLFHGHHPVMEELCRRNAERLNVIFDSVGWPGGWAADWVLYHAIWSPDVMRRGLGLLRAAERRGEVEPLNVALLEDRILMLEGKPQQYGTQLEWDSDDVLNPLPVADPADVDVRRGAVGLGRLAERIEEIRGRREGRAHVRQPIALPAWARSVGWRE
jgi:hypothetical protein